jgi:hypothetical protein
VQLLLQKLLMGLFAEAVMVEVHRGQWISWVLRSMVEVKYGFSF